MTLRRWIKRMKIGQTIFIVGALLMISAIALDSFSIASNLTFIVQMVASILLYLVGWKIMTNRNQTEEIKDEAKRKKILIIVIPSFAFGSLIGAWFVHQKLPEFSTLELGIIFTASFFVASAVIFFLSARRKSNVEQVAARNDR